MNKEGFQCLSVEKDLSDMTRLCLHWGYFDFFVNIVYKRNGKYKRNLRGKTVAFFSLFTIFFVVYWFQVKPFMRELPIPLILTNSTFFLELVSADLVDFVSLLTFQPQWQCL